MMTLCKIYRSLTKDNCYLYVPFDEDLKRVPEDLLAYFGKYELAMTLKLTPERTLAQSDIAEVLAQLKQKGYYLQLSSTTDEYMQIIRARNEKL